MFKKADALIPYATNRTADLLAIIVMTQEITYIRKGEEKANGRIGINQ